MAQTAAKDISKWQGNWQGNWQDTGEPIVLVKISGGDSGLYFDSKASQNYNGAKAAGRAVGGYHFAGGTDPVAEANFFVKGMSPLAENDVMALDWEVSNANPVGWCNSFVTQVHNTTGVWPLIYMNLATLRAYDWTPVTKNCGLWLADWNGNPDGTIATSYPYVMQQYADGPNYDRDMFFGTVDQFNEYGWHTTVAPPTTPVPAPQPAPPSAPLPEPVATPPVLPDLNNNVPTPVVEPTPEPVTTPTDPPAVEPPVVASAPAKNIVQVIVTAIVAAVTALLVFLHLR